jgi:hypothetical protein
VSRLKGLCLTFLMKRNTFPFHKNCEAIRSCEDQVRFQDCLSSHNVRRAANNG